MNDKQILRFCVCVCIGSKYDDRKIWNVSEIWKGYALQYLIRFNVGCPVETIAIAICWSYCLQWRALRYSVHFSAKWWTKNSLFMRNNFTKSIIVLEHFSIATKALVDWCARVFASFAKNNKKMSYIYVQCDVHQIATNSSNHSECYEFIGLDWILFLLDFQSN